MKTNPTAADFKRELLIFRDGSPHRYLTTPLLVGEQGNIQTLKAMSQIVSEDRTQPDLRNFILREIVGRVPGHDFIGELEACFLFARDRITYRKDPVHCERVADVWSTLYALNPNEPEGDCGIKSTFFATCAAALGHRPFFAVIKQRPDQPAFNHVYVDVWVNGGFRPYDPTPEDMPSGSEIRAAKKYRWQIFE